MIWKYSRRKAHSQAQEEAKKCFSGFELLQKLERSCLPPLPCHNALCMSKNQNFAVSINFKVAKKGEKQKTKKSFQKMDDFSALSVPNDRSESVDAYCDSCGGCTDKREEPCEHDVRRKRFEFF